MNKEMLSSEAGRKNLANFLSSIVMLIIIILFDNVGIGLAIAIFSNFIFSIFLDNIYGKK